MTTLAEIIKLHGGLIQTGPFGSQLKQSEYSEEGISVVMPKDISKYGISTTNIAKITEQKAEQLSRHSMKVRTIVFPRRGDIGKCALITAQNEGYLCGTGCIKIELPENYLDPDYFYYFLLQKKITEWLERNAVGSTMLNLNTKIIGRIEVPDVPIEEQRNRASIMKSYDSLIQNNRRRIELLEKFTSSIYTEWFERFQFPEHDKVNYQGNLPEGWCFGTLSNLVSVKSGFAFKSKDWQETGNPVVKIKNIRANHSVDVEKYQCVNDRIAENAAQFILNENDILIAMTGATIGKVGILPKVKRRYYQNQRVGKFTPTVDYPINGFLYCLTTSKNFQANIQNLAGGAAQPNISANQIESIDIPIPPKKLLKKFDDLTFNSFKQRQVLIEKNNKLSQARDLLLPKLMSGEITV
jgi:type I restriction enzyme S subunit